MRHNFGTFKRLMVEPVVFETKEETETFGFGAWVFRRADIPPYGNDVHWQINVLLGKLKIELSWAHLCSPWSKDVLSYPVENGVRMLPNTFWNKYRK